MARPIRVDILGDSRSLERAFQRSARGATRFTKEIDRMGRGVAAGSGLFRGLGRSIAFASGGFVAFASLSAFIRSSVDAAREAAVAQRALAAQLKANGESFKANRDEVEKASLSYGKFGFENDEVVASLTVLDRATGNIQKSMRLQGLVADIARVRNIGLAQAAAIVGKVFGGQETALRRAVPGLSKTAKGTDLLREAQEKLAGQAAANTTAAERFHATLHNTEEIIGAALLPTLNKYLNALGGWLEKMNESGRLERDVGTAAKFLNDALSAARTLLTPVVEAFKALSYWTGSTKNALIALGVAFAAFKSAQLAASLLMIAERMGLIGTAAEASAVKVRILRATLLGPAGIVAAAGVAGLAMQKSLQDAIERAQKARDQQIEQGSGLERALVPNVAKRIRAMKRAGWDSATIIRILRQQLGGSLKADDIIAEAFSFATGSDPKLRARIKALQDRVTKPLLEARRAVARRVSNQTFDARVDRLLNRSQYDALRDQLRTLEQVATLIDRRIAITRNVGRKLDLEDKLLQVSAQARGIREQLRQQFLDALQFRVETAQATQGLSDDLAALERLRAYLVKRIKAEKDNLDLRRQLLGVQGQIGDVLKQQAQQRAAAREARQFARLGFGPSGEDLIPGIAALRKQRGRIREAISGTFLDTGKTRSLLRRIREVLSGGLGAVGRDVRQKIAEILADLDRQLKAHDKDATTRFQKTNASAILAGIGLSPEQRRRLRARLAVIGPGGSAPIPSGQFAGGVVVHGGIHLHGVQDVKGLENELAKRRKQRAASRRAAR